MSYVDAFVLIIQKKNLAAYRTLSRKAGKIWREFGALQYVECAGHDLDTKMKTTFPSLLSLKSSEVAVFSWILYKSRAERQRINKLVCKDPRLEKMMHGKKLPFDMERMAMGGFKPIVEM